VCYVIAVQFNGDVTYR